MIICDIDNVLADDSWRVSAIDHEHIDPMRRFHEYHQLCLHDPFENRHLVRSDGEDDWPVILLTAQPWAYRHLRRNWLWRNKVSHQLVLFRRDDDFRSSVDVKRDMLLDLQTSLAYKLKTHVSIAYDDRQDVIDMYREEFGLPAERVAINEYVWAPCGAPTHPDNQERAHEGE